VVRGALSLQANVHSMLRCASFLAQNTPPVKSALTVIVVNDNISPCCGMAIHWPQAANSRITRTISG
jgi:hypothetical protein